MGIPLQEVAKTFSKYVTNFESDTVHSAEAIEYALKKAGYIAVETGDVNKLRAELKRKPEGNTEGLNENILSFIDRFQRIASVGLSTTETISLDNALRVNKAELATIAEHNRLEHM